MKFQALFILFPYAIDAFTSPSSVCNKHNRVAPSTLKPPAAPLPLRKEMGQPLFANIASLSAISEEPEGLTPEEELELVKLVMGDVEDLDAILEQVETMQKRPEPEPEVGIQSVGCAVDVAVDVIGLILSVAGIPGGKKVSRNIWRKLPRSAKQKIIRLIRTMNGSNFAERSFEILKTILDELTWRALRDSFSDFGWWDAIKLAASLSAIVATGGAAFLINMALQTIAIAELLIAIANCEEIVG